MHSSPMVIHEDPDVARMLRVVAGDRDAFAELVQHHADRIFRRLFRALTDRQEAEDRVQEVFLRIFRNRHRYRPQSRFSTWIDHIAHNVLRNAIRTRKRNRMVTVGRSFDRGVAHCMEDAMDRGLEAWQALEYAELAQSLAHAIAALSVQQRRVFQLRFLNCTFEQIANELSVTTQAAKSLMYRARLELRNSLQYRGV